MVTGLVHVTPKKVRFSDVVGRMRSLEEMVTSIHAEISNAMTEIRQMSRTTMHEVVGDKVLLVLLQLAMMEDLPTVTKEKRVDIILRAVEEAVKDYAKGEHASYRWDINSFLEEVLAGDHPAVPDIGQSEPMHPEQDASEVNALRANMAKMTTLEEILKRNRNNKVLDRIFRVTKPRKACKRTARKARGRR